MSTDAVETPDEATPTEHDSVWAETEPGTPMPAAPEPRGVSSAVLWGLFWGLLFAALGIIAIREALLAWGLGGTAEWPGLLHQLDGLSYQPWVGGVGAVAVLLGFLILVATFRRRPRRNYRLAATTGVYLRHSEAARLVELTASSVAGVLSARVRPSRRIMRVTISTTGAAGIADEVEQLVTARLSALADPPEVKVRALAAGRQAGESR